MPLAWGGPQLVILVEHCSAVGRPVVVGGGGGGEGQGEGAAVDGPAHLTVGSSVTALILYWLCGIRLWRTPEPCQRRGLGMSVRFECPSIPFHDVAHFRNRLGKELEGTWSRTAARSASAASVVLPLPGARCRSLRFHFAPPHNRRVLLERLTLTTATGPSHACPPSNMSFAIFSARDARVHGLPYYCITAQSTKERRRGACFRSAQLHDVNGPRRRSG
ncbi:hypothetical protein BC826DRAFT_681591 [Russula brevipes]|nr:hypothetical protein BC826DRAFT_681591 [Russula brevipes]